MSVYKQGLFTESVSATTATPTVELGTTRTVAGRDYVYGYNGGKEASVNKVVVLSGVSNYTFVVTYATSVVTSPTPLGVVRNATIAAGSYGWVMTRGFCDLINEGAASVAAGDPIILSLDGSVREATATSVVTQIVWNGIIARAMQGTDATIGAFGAYVRMG